MATTKAAPGKKGLINFDFLQKLGKVLMTERRYLVPHSEMRALSQIRTYCFIESEEFQDDGVHIVARVPLNHLSRWDEYLSFPVRPGAL